jgi:phosphate transport system protein
MRARLIEPELARLREKLSTMAKATERAIECSIRALHDLDLDLADSVICDDDVIDQMEVDIDQACVDILVLKQPAASDLRFVISVARVAPVLERIADHAVNIAKLALSLKKMPGANLEMDVTEMASIVQSMLVEGVDAFLAGDPERAQATITRDDEVDSLYDLHYAQLIEKMKSNHAALEQGVQWAFVLKHLERIADYVTNICEQIVYMARGRVIKHTIW